jgi:hypothetical protein
MSLGGVGLPWGADPLGNAGLRWQGAGKALNKKTIAPQQVCKGDWLVGEHAMKKTHDQKGR